MGLYEGDFIDTSKKVTFNPGTHDFSELAKCFNYRGALSQAVIDKIVDSYDAKTNTFKDVTIQIDDFCKNYDNKILVNGVELESTISKIYKNID